MLDALLGLIEEQLEREPGDPDSDLRLVGEQVQRIVALHVRLAESALDAAARDRVRE